jgi:hypothetical protein
MFLIQSVSTYNLFFLVLIVPIQFFPYSIYIRTNFTLLITYQCHTRGCDMFRYKRTIFRERNMPVLKPIASDKLLFTRFHSLQYLSYINNINKGAYYRLSSLVNNSLSLAVGFKPGILSSPKMVRLYRNMSQLRV